MPVGYDPCKVIYMTYYLLLIFLFPPGKVRQPEESDIPMDCWFKIWSENLIVHVKWYKSAGLEMGSQTDTVALGENCTELTSSDESVASVGLCVCRVFVTRINSTDTGNGTQEAVPSK